MIRSKSGEASYPSLALVELSSIARGFEVTDRMLKAAEVELVLARTICSGKYMILVAGEQHMVEASLSAALDVAAECAVDHFIIQNVHPDVFPALSSTNVFKRREAMGILESFSVAALVEALDQVAKTAPVEMVECRLSMALGGKAFLVFTGDVDAVLESLEAGARVIVRRGLLVNKVVIPHPRNELFESLL